MLLRIYPIISSTVMLIAAAFILLLILRLIFSYSDPNPFGTVGRFSFKIKKITERFVYPAARVLGNFRIDARYAPLVTIFITIIVAYFALGIVWTTLFIIGGLAESISSGNIKATIGYLLYAVLSIYILFIFIRFLSSRF